MQKFLSIFMLCLYLLASVGVTVSAHYCGGDLASLALFNKTNCCCSEEEESKKDDCCKNEIKTFRIGIDQLKEEQTGIKVSSFEAEQLSPSSLILLASKMVAAKRIKNVPLPKPPETNSLPSYKRNHSFLFYC